MKSAFLFPSLLAAAGLAVLAAPSSASVVGGQARSPIPRPFAEDAAAGEITRTGVIERRVSIGGETTGWVLRDARGQKIELLLPIAAFANLREGAHVAIKGKIESRKYPERGEVSVFIVREIHEMVN